MAKRSPRSDTPALRQKRSTGGKGGESAERHPMLRTKLHPPRLDGDLIARAHLLDRLRQDARRPLTLVCAPAGFGKTTLVAQWLAAGRRPVAWVSLSRGDGDLGSFGRYVVAAIESCFASSCPLTRGLLNASAPPTPPVLAAGLANDLEALAKPLVLVLDDYYRIDGRAVHDLLADLLQHPPPKLRLVIATRYDPPLPLARLRAYDMLSEIRIAELKLSLEEVAELFSRALGRSLNAELVSHLHGLTEGWLVGLQLLLAASRLQQDQEKFLAGLRGDVREIQDFLCEELLSRRPDELQDCLLESSLPQRLSPSYCEQVCSRSQTCEDCGGGLIGRLTRAGLPMASLDGTGDWYRGHSVFRKMLLNQLEKRRSKDELRALHGRVARWLAGEGFIEEAAGHALAAGVPEFAAQLVVAQRHDFINRGEWTRLERLLDALPPELVDANPALLLARIWICDSRTLDAEPRELVDRVDAMVKGKSGRSRALRAEIDAIRCNHLFKARDFDAAIASARRALKELPAEAHAIRAKTILFKVWANQMTGRIEEAISLVFAVLKQDPFPDESHHSVLMLALTTVYWARGDLAGTRQAATRGLELSERYHQADLIRNFHYFLGVCHYLGNELEEAARHQRAGIDERYPIHLQTYVCGATELIYCHMACRRMEEARRLIESVRRRAMLAGEEWPIQPCKALEAELALREGRLPVAMAWAKDNTPALLPGLLETIGPHLIWARVVVAEGQPATLKQAALHFKKLEKMIRSRHNRLHLIQVLNQHALLRDRLGEEQAAIAKLGESLELTEAASCFRLMLDDGPPMADLLQRLADRLPAPALVRQILDAFGVEIPAVAAAAKPSSRVPIESLTHRELDVLELIAERLYDKEIADRLSISQATVKTHLKHIYGKLDAGNRRQAVARAEALGILGTR